MQKEQLDWNPPEDSTFSERVYQKIPTLRREIARKLPYLNLGSESEGKKTPLGIYKLVHLGFYSLNNSHFLN